MKKIAFFIPGLKIGGIERVFITYADSLIKKGYEVSFIVCKMDGALASALPPALRIVSLGEKRLRNSIRPLFNYLQKSPVEYLISGSNIANALCIILGKLAQTETKIIVSQHNYFNIEEKNGLATIIIRSLFNHAFGVLSVSKGISSMLIQQHVKPSKIKTIYNPIDIDYIQSSSKKETKHALPSQYVLFLGPLGEIKNLIFLLNAFKIVQDINPEIKLVVLGEGPLKDTLIDHAQKIHMDHKTLFLDPESNPFPIIDRAQAVILPSLSEALPTVILESLALGKTVVATPTNGATDLLEDGKYGYLSNSFVDTNEFAQLILKSIENPMPIELLKDRAKSFDVSRKVIELETFFNEQ